MSRSTAAESRRAAAPARPRPGVHRREALGRLRRPRARRRDPRHDRGHRLPDVARPRPRPVRPGRHDRGLSEHRDPSPRPIGVFMFPRGPVGETAIVGQATQIGTVILVVGQRTTRGDQRARTAATRSSTSSPTRSTCSTGRPTARRRWHLRSRRQWGHAFEAAFLAHKARAARASTSLLRDYAITNEAEYFAVAAEAFFEKPHQLRDALPDVYASLATYFGLDLANK